MVPAATIGQFSIDRIVEQQLPYIDARKFFPELTDEMLAICHRDLPPGQMTRESELVLSFHSYVVKTGRHIILVDTCCGNDKERPLRPAFHRMKKDYLPALAAAGVRPEQVDFVMCTHLHWDHVGWNTHLVDGTWRPTFPNAKYIMSKKEYEHWDGVYRSGVRDTHMQAFEDSVMPVHRANQAVLVGDDYELEKGISVEPCPGHTVGNIVINVASGGSRGVITGDVMHHQIQLRFPELSTYADEDAALARITRTALIEKHADTGTLILPGHFPAPSVGRIETAPAGGFRFVS